MYIYIHTHTRANRRIFSALFTIFINALKQATISFLQSLHQGNKQVFWKGAIKVRTKSNRGVAKESCLVLGNFVFLAGTYSAQCFSIRTEHRLIVNPSAEVTRPDSQCSWGGHRGLHRIISNPRPCGYGLTIYYDLLFLKVVQLAIGCPFFSQCPR